MENVQGVSGPQKKEVAISSVKEIYKKVGPDIPYIPKPFETWMDNLLLDKALSEFIYFIVGKYKENGIFQ